MANSNSGNNGNHSVESKDSNNREILKVSDLSVTYASQSKTKRVVLEGVSFTLAAGEKVGILGESGSGKSTCARALLRLLSHHAKVSGKVTLFGHDVFALSERELTQIRPLVQMVFQDPFSSFDPRQRILDALNEPLLVHFDLTSLQMKARIDAVLAEVGLNELVLSKFPGQLSGGQLQRVAIARALLLEPKVLVADEAVSALDLSLQAQIVTLLSELATKRNMSVVFISHDLRLVRYFCDRVLVLRGGKIVESGTVEKVFASPEACYTKQLIAAAITHKNFNALA